MKTLPESFLGKWAVGMTITCILLLVIFFLLMAMGLVDFDTGHWWDVTIGIAVPIGLIAFVLIFRVNATYFTIYRILLNKYFILC
jgi:membrane protein YdbS with pleckstrin-like domain